mgnify:CR=1 FL=1
MEELIRHLDFKLHQIVDIFKEYFHEANIKNKKLNEAIQYILKEKKNLKLDGRLKGSLSTYDVEESDLYLGSAEVENYLE